MRFKNVSGEPLELPALGLTVEPDEIFEATGAHAESLLQQDNFRRIDTPARQKAAAARRSDESATAETEES